MSAKATFDEYIDRWLEEHRPRLEESTYRDYQVHAEQRLKPFFGEMNLSSIAPTDVWRYVAELVRGAAAGANYSPGTRERIMLPAEHREMDYLRLYEIPQYLDACSPACRPLAEQCGYPIASRVAARKLAGRAAGALALAAPEDAQRARFEVDVPERQCERLADPHSCRRSDCRRPARRRAFAVARGRDRTLSCPVVRARDGA